MHLTWSFTWTELEESEDSGRMGAAARHRSAATVQPQAGGMMQPQAGGMMQPAGGMMQPAPAADDNNPFA